MILRVVALAAALAGLILCRRRTGNRGFTWLAVALGLLPLVRLAAGSALVYIRIGLVAGMDGGTWKALVLLTHGCLALARATTLIVGAFKLAAGLGRGAAGRSAGAIGPRPES